MARRLMFRGIASKPRLTHYMFRFPSKFHPPFARWALEEFSDPGDLVLDPMNGSGTTLVEALNVGRSGVGADIDPLACLVSRAKTRVLDPRELNEAWDRLLTNLARQRRPGTEYERLMHRDLSEEEYRRERRGHWLPKLEGLSHWFRRYVLVDLAKIRGSIMRSRLRPSDREFFLGCFAGIVRSASNADPVPVSGLEVTSHMKRLDAAGRYIDPFELFERRVRREMKGMTELHTRIEGYEPRAEARTWKVDVRRLESRLRADGLAGTFSTVLTSPPYCNAVEYARRHKLEAYWLGLVANNDDHVELSRRYIGTTAVRASTRIDSLDIPAIDRVIKRVAERNQQRAVALWKYFCGIERLFEASQFALRRGGKLVLVLGDSRVAGVEVPTFALSLELGREYMEHRESFSYRIANRYMSYSRRNGASISRDRVAVFEKVAR